LFVIVFQKFDTVILTNLFANGIGLMACRACCEAWRKHWLNRHCTKQPRWNPQIHGTRSARRNHWLSAFRVVQESRCLCSWPGILGSC